jgi:hypothetical protein
MAKAVALLATLPHLHIFGNQLIQYGQQQQNLLCQKLSPSLSLSLAILLYPT